MATQIFPLEVWTSQITQASIPANNNALRVQVLEAPAIAIQSTPPGSPAEDDMYIVDSGATGAWASFGAGNVVIYKGGTWLEFEAFEGFIKSINGGIYIFDGTSWNEAISPPTPPSSFAEVVTITASETLGLTRVGKFLDAAHASTPIVLTVPQNSATAFPIDTEIHVRWAGDAQVSILAGSGVVVQKPSSQTLNLKEKFAVVTLKKVATDTWALFGLLEQL